MSHPINTLRPSTRGTGPTSGERQASPAPSRTSTASAVATRPRALPARDRAAGRPYRERSDLGQAVLFAAGMALGAVIGAGTALLTAPQSGIEARLALKRRARRARVQAEDRWDGLGRELRGAARRRKRDLRRKIAASRWRASDAFEV